MALFRGPWWLRNLSGPGEGGRSHGGAGGGGEPTNAVPATPPFPGVAGTTSLCLRFSPLSVQNVRMVAVAALVVAWIALSLGVWAVIVATRGGWERESRRLSEALEDGIAQQRREMIKLRDEWTDYADRSTKRYRQAARALAELEKREQEDVADEEPEDVPSDDGPARPDGRMPALPPHMVATGAFGAGRAG